MRTRSISARLLPAIVGLSLVLAACEDEGNPGDDSLLSGGSLIIVAIVVAVIVGIVMMRRRQP